MLKTSKIEGLDGGIAPFVGVLREHGIHTIESCQGGEGHFFYEPIIRFHGERDQGWKALHIAQERGWPVSQLRRCWSINDGEPTGPEWEMTFIDLRD